MIFGNKLNKIDSYLKKGKSAKIVPLLMDKKQEVRLQAIKAMGSIGDDTSVNNLILLLTDSDPVVRKQAAASMGDIGKDVCKTHLQSRVKTEKDEDSRSDVPETDEEPTPRDDQTERTEEEFQDVQLQRAIDALKVMVILEDKPGLKKPEAPKEGTTA